MARYGGITFLGASLLFLVQPLFAREILPWFGGAQSVWTTSLVCFQVLLLGGYLYAHLGRRLGIRLRPCCTVHSSCSASRCFRS